MLHIDSHLGTLAVYQFKPLLHSGKEPYSTTELHELLSAYAYSALLGLVNHKLHVGQNGAGFLAFRQTVRCFPERPLLSDSDGIHEIIFLHI